MNKIDILKLNDNELDKVVKIQGTDFDRKRKVTAQLLKKMIKLENRGKSYKDIAKKFGFTTKTVRYNLDPEYREFWKANYAGPHTGKNHITKNNRVSYKRELVASGVRIETI